MTNKVYFVFLGIVLSSILAARLAWNPFATRNASLTTQKAFDGGTSSKFQVPLCGRLDDRKIHLPPDWTSFTPPATGQSYVDPVFGCPVKRLTNSEEDRASSDGTHVSLSHAYSTISPINANDTMLLINSDDGALRVIDGKGVLVVPPSKMPAMNNGHPVWDAIDGNSFYYTHGKILYKGTIKGSSVKSTALQTFKEYSGIVMPDDADLSQDGDHIALVGQNKNNTLDVFVWSLSRGMKTSTYTTACKIGEWDVTQSPQPGCLHKLQLTANNLLIIQFAEDGGDSEQGLRLWDGSKLVHLQDHTNHIDTGYDLKGTAVFIGVGRESSLAGIRNPCPSGWGLDVRQLNDVSSAACLLDKQPSWHVSYRGGGSQPWAAISFFDDRKAGPELFNGDRSFEAPSLKNWRLYEDEIMLARVDGGAIYRLAHARARSAEGYGSTPRAAISRDGKYVIFDSNMAYPNGCPARMHVPDECTDVYLMEIH